MRKHHHSFMAVDVYMPFDHQVMNETSRSF